MGLFSHFPRRYHFGDILPNGSAFAAADATQLRAMASILIIDFQRILISIGLFGFV